jgi:hypothetical protein
MAVDHGWPGHMWPAGPHVAAALSSAIAQIRGKALVFEEIMLAWPLP